MTTEIAAIREFLEKHHPFDLLPGHVLTEVAGALEITYRRRDEVLMRPGDKVDCLYLVRSGAVETRDPDGQLLARLSEGECCGVRALLRGGTAVNGITVIEDCLLYQIPAALFDRLRQEYKSFQFYFAAFDGGSLGASISGAGEHKSLDILTTPVADLLVRGPVTVTGALPVRDAARMMRDEKVSCLLVTEGDALVGILTDRDLRNRVVAEDRSSSTPVGEVMSRDPNRIEASAYAFDALLLMSRKNIHHLPVLDGGKVAGCLTSSTLISTHTQSPLFLARRIHGCKSAGDLAEIVARMPQLVNAMVESGATAHSIGHIVSTLTDSITVRLIKLAEETLGPPPVAYAWLAAGSQARHEQTAVSDQDNCMILSDDYVEAEHGGYFKALSDFVCTGLDTAGYVFCPGEMMAKTDQWRQPLAMWKRYFSKWIDQPEPEALMLSCVFFDLRMVHGEAALFEDLHELVLDKSRKNRIFQTYMARNAMSHEPPIGFFKNFVLIRGGDHNHTFDLKHNGVVPIIDLARVYGLTAGLPMVNTQERLVAAGDSRAISADGAQDLKDALEFISLTRLRHQARMAAQGAKADNFMAPEELSSFERSHLKSAFLLVKTMQASMATTFQLGRF